MTDLTPRPAALEGEVLDNLHLHLATFGRGRCNWLAVDTWATEARAPRQDDLCAGPAAWYVEVNNGHGLVLTHLCDGHTDRVRTAPGFVSAQPARQFAAHALSRGAAIL